MQTIYVRATAPQVVSALAGLIPQLVGQARGPQTDDLARGLQLRLGTTMLSLVKDNFVNKARGGAGVDGEKWASLAPSTIARRRRPHGVPTRRQAYRRLRESYVYLAGAVGRVQNAARKKRLEQAKKKYTAAYAPVEILIDTRVMFNSLSPGVSGPSGNPNQVFRMNPGEIVVGTNVPYAKYHQTGTKRMPQRRLWPESRKWPTFWRQSLGEAARSGVVRAVVLLLTGRRVSA